MDIVFNCEQPPKRHRLSHMIVNRDETPEGSAEVENPTALQLCDSTIKRWLVEARPLGKRV